VGKVPRPLHISTYSLRFPCVFALT
jgi:hypothetical protein